MMKTKKIVIGDIHGAFKALKQVLQKARLNDGDTLIFIGYYVDGWPESARVVDELIALSSRYDCVFIKGNHDIDCASWLAGNEADENWLEAKQESMIDSYKEIDEEKRERHLDFFASLRDYYIDSQNCLFVHAGFTSLKGPGDEFFSYNFNHDRTLLETAIAMDKTLTSDSNFYPKRLKLFSEIFIGHTPTTKYGITGPLNAANLWNVDTGATFQGRITAMDILTKEYWQSDLVEELYGSVMGNGRLLVP